MFVPTSSYFMCEVADLCLFRHEVTLRYNGQVADLCVNFQDAYFLV
jgi:hypothetical protein